MKKPAIIILFVLAAFACRKDAMVSPITRSIKASNIVIIPKPVDTMPDNAAFRLRIAQDNVNYDETILIFNHSDLLTFEQGKDAIHFQGFGLLSLASMSSDGHDLAINFLPYTQGTSVGLNVNARQDCAVTMSINYQNKMPASSHVWLKDTYLNDSTDLRTGSYKFNIAKADTNTFGSRRFKVVVQL
jgi:hypothetical protein